MEDFEKTKGTTRKTYICKDCRERVRLTHKPSYCPTCGSTNIVRDNEKAIETAQIYIDSMNNIIDDLDRKWDEYARLHAQYELLARSLSTYITRRIIPKAMVPKPHKHSLAIALKRYREELGIETKEKD